MVMLCNMDELRHFSENDLLTPVTQNDPGLIFKVITFVEGVKLMHIHCSEYDQDTCDKVSRTQPRMLSTRILDVYQILQPLVFKLIHRKGLT